MKTYTNYYVYKYNKNITTVKDSGISKAPLFDAMCGLNVPEVGIHPTVLVLTDNNEDDTARVMSDYNLSQDDHTYACAYGNFSLPQVDAAYISEIINTARCRMSNKGILCMIFAVVIELNNVKLYDKVLQELVKLCLMLENFQACISIASHI